MILLHMFLYVLHVSYFTQLIESMNILLLLSYLKMDTALAFTHNQHICKHMLPILSHSPKMGTETAICLPMRILFGV